MNLPVTFETAMSGTEKWMLDCSSTASYSAAERAPAASMETSAAAAAGKRLIGDLISSYREAVLAKEGADRRPDAVVLGGGEVAVLAAGDR